MKARDYRTTFAALSDDMMKFINSHPDNFDILLFKARNAEMETVAEATDVVGSLESQERSITYDDAVIVAAMKVPGGGPVAIADTGDDPMASVDQPIILLIADNNVPVQSFFEIDEYQRDGSIFVQTYRVNAIEQFGEAPGMGKQYICSIFKDEAYTFIEQPDNELPEDRATDVSLTPTLKSSIFAVHGEVVAHAFSNWRIWESGDTWEFPVYEIKSSTALRSVTVPAGKLENDQAYFWDVQYIGPGAVPEESEPSEPTRFTTLEADQ